ncbi:MAG: hypothetical protein RLY83_697 [Actinomycetota bacterium]|jgi:cytochrome oxidase assembly protein ShyY1
MKKWLNWIALVVIFAVACGFLSNWQFARRETKLASIALVNQNYDSAPVPLSELSTGSVFALPKQTWRKVTVTGHYLAEKLLLVRNRPNDGQPGFEELVPFQATDGALIYVSRGWLPSGSSQDFPDDLPVPDKTQTTILAHLISQEPVLNRSAPKGQIATVNVKLANKATGLKSSFSNGYLRLISETPTVGASLKPMPAPATEEGNNLSYALQWILFGLMAALALIWRIRKDQQQVRGVVQRVKVRRSDLDAEFEDESTKAK